MNGQRKARTHYVRIIYDPRRVPEKKTHVVLPGDLYVISGDTVIFETKNVSVTIWFPNMDQIFDLSSRGLQHQINIALDSQSPPYIVKDNLPRDGIFPYVVYCIHKDDVNVFAEGNSSPTMIVED